jgi:hypothetical protein
MELNTELFPQLADLEEESLKRSSWKRKQKMNSKKNIIEIFHELERNSELIHTDRDGTKYYAPKVNYNRHTDAERKEKVKFAKASHRQEMSCLLKEIWFDLEMLLFDIWWYLEIFFTG